MKKDQDKQVYHGIQVMEAGVNPVILHSDCKIGDEKLISGGTPFKQVLTFVGLPGNLLLMSLKDNQLFEKGILLWVLIY